MLSRILVGVDDSAHADKAFEYATSLAKRSEGSHLLIVNIFEKFASVGYSITAELQKNREEMLRKYLNRAKTMGLKSVDIREEEGSSAANQILEIAKRENIDTIVVGSRGQYLAEDFILGSTSYKLAQSAKCALVIIR
jgi:nucleotide-binding universal stress UspA family protein